MPKNTSGLKKGGPGRPKGIPNKATREIKDFAIEFLSSPEYVQSATRRVLSGRAPHLETLWYHYGYGKPKDTVQLDGTVSVDVASARERLTRVLAGLTGRVGTTGLPDKPE